jgi:hypothetical protein
MRRAACLAAVLCIAAGAMTVSQPQDPAPRAAKPYIPLAKQRTGIRWVASFDRAMTMMGNDKRPVILYFTYDT